MLEQISQVNELKELVLSTSRESFLLLNPLGRLSQLTSLTLNLQYGELDTENLFDALRKLRLLTSLSIDLLRITNHSLIFSFDIVTPYIRNLSLRLNNGASLTTISLQNIPQLETLKFSCFDSQLIQNFVFDLSRAKSSLETLSLIFVQTQMISNGLVKNLKEICSQVSESCKTKLELYNCNLDEEDVESLRSMKNVKVSI
eukprot:TRINITY_DN22603_c0_g1_i1.p2 TRINITY_DN22603_c0_g1~~TRINITY_DN22603_c0_g1_i1.p2  ORF type:complete len:201 (+),score=20.02 TRINITY_DN22603_c0_g1_i1:1552-2154(+)